MKLFIAAFILFICHSIYAQEIEELTQKQVPRISSGIIFDYPSIRPDSLNRKLIKSLDIQSLGDFTGFFDALQPEEITFGFAGDIMCHSTQFKYARTAADSFDFKPVYSVIDSVLHSPDFMIGNLETTFAGPNIPYSGYPMFNTPDAFLRDLAFAGFDVLITANNHSLDRGKKSLFRTIDKIKEYGMINSGTVKDEDREDSILVLRKNGISAALISFAYDTNHFPDLKKYINIISDSLLEKKINLANKLKPDALIVYFHFGNEYWKEPSARQKEVVQKAINLGADIIIGSHPHVLQPVDTFAVKSGRMKTGLIAYSLGNFVSNQRWRYSDGSVVLNFTIKKNNETKKTTIENVEYLPIWVFKGETGSGRQYIIYPEFADSNSYPEYFTDYDWKMMKQSFGDSKKIINKYSDFTEAVKTEAVKTDAVKTDAVKTEAVKTEAVKTDAVKYKTEKHNSAKAAAKN